MRTSLRAVALVTGCAVTAATGLAAGGAPAISRPIWRPSSPCAATGRTSSWRPRSQWQGEAKAFLTGWEAGGHTVWAQALRHPSAGAAWRRSPRTTSAEAWIPRRSRAPFENQILGNSFPSCSIVSGARSRRKRTSVCPKGCDALAQAAALDRARPPRRRTSGARHFASGGRRIDAAVPAGRRPRARIEHSA